MGLLSKIARKLGFVRGYLVVVRHTHGQTRIIHSIWPPYEISDKLEPLDEVDIEGKVENNLRVHD
ncbi:hypothetical protein HAV15_012808 [Penicillium sp. str. |uniref:Str. FM013 n=1 Tax=Penicillium camemberti (strain FM 013) TaxID=1429867 RepID=A0A0G4P7E4_PENC3|nr:hypothetical protein HAV15_012808 [Penicillium sp. str. \